jgi:hypothetical protein
MARKMRVDKKQGAQLIVTGPKKSDLYTIIISNLTPRGTDSEGNQQYVVQFTVQGTIETNIIKGGISNPIPMSPNTLADPIQAADYVFYIFVDKVDIDYVYLTVARRPAVFKNRERIKISNNLTSFGAIVIEGETPDPIMTASPSSP